MNITLCFCVSVYSVSIIISFGLVGAAECGGTINLELKGTNGTVFLMDRFIDWSKDM